MHWESVQGEGMTKYFSLLKLFKHKLPSVLIQKLHQIDKYAFKKAKTA